MLRYTTDQDRYDAEVRMHSEMGLNLIRVWGGGITERPMFYEAADRYGIFVMQVRRGEDERGGREEEVFVCRACLCCMCVCCGVWCSVCALERVL